uniref:Uncharacterized protein n=1 Tax=Eptatretus burgeri TaxID=7764 RepID=A0A8C4R085_EPTBU
MCGGLYPGELPPPYETVLAQARAMQPDVIHQAAILTRHLEHQSERHSDSDSYAYEEQGEGTAELVGDSSGNNVQATELGECKGDGVRSSTGDTNSTAEKTPGMVMEPTKGQPPSLADLKAYGDAKAIVVKLLETSGSELPPVVRRAPSEGKAAIGAAARERENRHRPDEVMNQTQPGIPGGLGATTSLHAGPSSQSPKASQAGPLSPLHRPELSSEAERAATLVGVIRETVL